MFLEPCLLVFRRDRYRLKINRGTGIPRGHRCQGQAATRSDNIKEHLQYLAAGTAGTRTAQDAGYGAVTDRAAG